MSNKKRSYRRPFLVGISILSLQAFLTLWCGFVLTMHRPHTDTLVRTARNQLANNLSKGDYYVNNLHENRTKCVAIGMISRSSESELRQWHRNAFLSARRMNESVVDIHLLFNIAKPADERQLRYLQAERDMHKDLVIQNFTENEECMYLNRCLTRNADALFRSISDLCRSKNYSASYFIKADDDIVLNYDLIAKVFLALPNESVYFGRMLVNMPSVALERYIAEFSQSFYPVWPQGVFHGFSGDILDLALLPEKTATILRADVGYVFPWSDRGAGMLLYRAQLHVKNTVFLKGVYFMCSPERFNCYDYGNSIAFHVGHGLSGPGETRQKQKMRLMQSVLEIQRSCPDETFFEPDHLFTIDGHFRRSKVTEWLEFGCSSVDDYSKNVSKHFFEMSVAAEVSLFPVNFSCAERFYRGDLHAIESLSATRAGGNAVIEDGVSELANALARKARMAGSQGVFPGQLHYLEKGYSSNSLHYFCPSRKRHNDFSCDRERSYRRRYPDVDRLVQEGVLSDGLSHYLNEGVKEGRTWGCHEKYQVPGYGSFDQCYDIYAEFIEKTRHIVAGWPFSGDKRLQEKMPEEHCNALLLVERHNHSWLDYVLRNHRRYLGPHWMFYLVAPEPLAKEWRSLYKGPMITVVTLPTVFGDLQDPSDYQKLFLSPFLWDVVKCENILVSSSESILFRHGIEDFFGYDIVGLPMESETFPSIYWRLLQAFYGYVGGSGGLSFRKRSALQRCLASCQLRKEGIPEDVWFTACVILADGNLPHPTIASRFGVGRKCLLDIPLGSHKMWQSCKLSSCMGAIVASRFHRDLFGDNNTNYPCPEGESFYLEVYDDVLKAVESGQIDSAWAHFNLHGQKEGRLWRCLFPNTKH